MDLKKPVDVMGWLAGNWGSLNKRTPALIINPEASPLDLLAWCWGEVASLNASSDSIADAGSAVEPRVLSAIFLHRLPPLQCVLEEAVTLLLAERAFQKIEA